MAIFHAHKQNLSRKKEHKACAAAAYRSGSLIHDKRYNEIHDYRRKRHVIRAGCGIVAPGGEQYTGSREDLWNAVEAMEKHPRAALASEWNIALPNELDRQQLVALARDIAQAIADQDGTLCDYALHHGHPKKALFDDSINENWHMHLMLPTRLYQNGELSRQRVAEYLSTSERKAAGITTSRADDVKAQRFIIADVINAHLQQAGLDVRVDPRTLKEQGIDRPAKKRLTPGELARERRGEPTRKGDYNWLCNDIKKGQEIAPPVVDDDGNFDDWRPR